MEKFLVELPLTGEYLTTVRLTTGGLCALVGDVEFIKDSDGAVQSIAFAG